MPKLRTNIILLGLSVVVGAGLLLLMQIGGTASAQGTTVGFDVDTTGNGATTLGAIAACRSVSTGQQFTVDVFVDEIPSATAFGGFNYRISFDDTRVQIVGQNHNQLLSSAVGSNVFDLSDSVPDAVSPHTVGAGDFGTAEVGPARGVLGRYTLEVLPTAPAGVFALTLSARLLSNAGGDPIPVDQVLDGAAIPQHGVIAVNQPCPTTGANLSITKTDSADPVSAGQPLNYNLSILNNGPFNSPNMILTNNLPAQVSFVSATPSQGFCNHLSGTVTCNLGTVIAGNNVSIAINTTTDGGASGSITNNASVTSTETDPDLSNNSDSEVTFVGAFADLAITKSDSSDPVRIGDPLSYSLFVTNSGPSNAVNAVVTDNLPAQTTFVSANASVGSCSQAAGTLTCNLGTMAGGASASITINVTADSITSELITNTASVTSSTADPDAADNSDSEATFVRTDQILTVVGVDTNSSGNGATSLGSIETCQSVSAGGTFTIDIFVDEIPAGRNLGGLNYR